MFAALPWRYSALSAVGREDVARLFVPFRGIE